MTFTDPNSLYSMTPLGFYLSMVTILTIFSILCSGFILTVNIQDWLKGRKLSPVDQILVAINLSSIGLSYSFGNYVFLQFLWPQLLAGYTFTLVFALLLFLTVSNSWFIAWLCLYFFAKIVDFKSSYLVKLKMKIDVAVPWLILFTEIVAFSSSLPLIWSFKWTLPNNSTSCNQTCPIDIFQFNHLYYTIPLGFSSNSAFFIVLVSNVCIVWSLCRHTYRMKKTLSKEERSRLRTHQKAAQTVVSLLLIYVVFYLTYVLMSLLSFKDTNIYYWITVWVSQSTSPSMSLVLILGNSKLHLAFHKIFCCSHH